MINQILIPPILHLLQWIQYNIWYDVWRVGINIQVVGFWVVTPCNGVVGYQQFRGPC